MNRKSKASPSGATAPAVANRASARIVTLVVVCFLAGLGLGGLWFSGAFRSGGRHGAPADSGPLSEATLTLLARLESPLEIRFYSVLDPANVPESLPAFSERVGGLLAEYSRAAEGKITVNRRDTRSDETAKAASADGITAFNLDKGDACYLGIALIQDGRKESLARLSPEWELGLESDLSRAIGRLIEGKARAGSAPQVTVDPATTEAVKQLLPNYASVSLAEGEQAIRQAALEEFKAAATNFATRVAEAQQRLTQAQNSGTEDERQAAAKQLQAIQAEQTQKLKEIAAKSQSQVEALQKLKSSAQ